VRLRSFIHSSRQQTDNTSRQSGMMAMLFTFTHFMKTTKDQLLFKFTCSRSCLYSSQRHSRLESKTDKHPHQQPTITNHETLLVLLFPFIFYLRACIDGDREGVLCESPSLCTPDLVLSLHPLPPLPCLSFTSTSVHHHTTHFYFHFLPLPLCLRFFAPLSSFESDNKKKHK
jgi:hypothetical protein